MICDSKFVEISSKRYTCSYGRQLTPVKSHKKTWRCGYPFMLSIAVRNCFKLKLPKGRHTSFVDGRGCPWYKIYTWPGQPDFEAITEGSLREWNSHKNNKPLQHMLGYKGLPGEKAAIVKMMIEHRLGIQANCNVLFDLAEERYDELVCTTLRGKYERP